MSTVLVQNDIEKFQNFVLRFYQKHGRHELPWRQTADPYKILVSELMLQQTQVVRVIPKFQIFISRFPSTTELSEATLSEVLELWQGLGYNRRAKYLLQLAQEIESKKTGFPSSETELQKLPGIGPYTASAIVTFAFNKPTTVIETNIRTVFIYHFFPGSTQKVHDSQLLPIIKKTVPNTNPQEWYWALMDYGSYLKKVLPNPSRKSKHHTKQSKFKGSLRQVRGEIIKILVAHDSLSEEDLLEKITSNKVHFRTALQQLLDEKLVVITDKKLHLP